VFILLKRIFDIALACILLLILSPIIVLSALLVRFYFGAPVLFRQERPGLYGEPFQIIKFRTMKNSRDADGILLADHVRLTPVGSFLRSLSLDELPELWNVLKGQMSIVGPRPLLMKYLPLYSPEQKRRHQVKPGITGLAQVKGRNALSWEDKFKLDIWYVDNQSLWLDIKIIFLTAYTVCVRDGISSDGNATTEEFTGTK
jgi:lipopolysaccharide/colanic/teichoic acid biosynthesis glycosyltransferase